MTRFEYMKNELDNAELKAQTLDDPVERGLFSNHAENLRERLGRMTPADASVVMFDDEDVSK
jgi:hypothetical protein